MESRAIVITQGRNPGKKARMKKTLVIEFEYDESTDDLCKAVGIADAKWQERIGDAILDSDSPSSLVDILTMFEAGAISGPEFIGLAMGGAQVVLRRAMGWVLKVRVERSIEHAKAGKDKNDAL